MRNVSRGDAQAGRLLDRARTIAVVGGVTAPRHRAALAYLKRVGYDVRLLHTPALADTNER